MKHATYIIRRLQHLGMSYFFYIPSRALEFISKSFPLICDCTCFQITMPPRRAVRDHPSRRNVEELEVPNTPNMQTLGEVTNGEFCEAIQMLREVMTNYVEQKRGSQQ